MPTEDDPRESIKEFTKLVDQNGLVKLFANRVRARILVTLLYSDEPLTTKEIAGGADIYQSVTIEALEAMEPFEIVESIEEDDETRYWVDTDDPVVEQIRVLAEYATERFYDGDI